MESKKLKVGLALGSGGARGLAHIGVIKVLEQNGVVIDFIAGSSIGALIGGMYASGLSIEKIEEIALSTNLKRVFSVFADPSLQKGFISGTKVEAYINECVEGKNFSECVIPFTAVATDLKTGDCIELTEGSLSQAIRASTSIPLVFKPCERDNTLLADGGLSQPVPVETVKKMGADIVIAVNLDVHYKEENKKFGLYEIAYDSLDILRHHLALSNAAKADISVEINTGNTYWYEFINGEDKIHAGEKGMRDAMPRLLELIGRGVA